MRGPRVLLATGPGEHTAYDLADGKATVGRHLCGSSRTPTRTPPSIGSAPTAACRTMAITLSGRYAYRRWTAGFTEKIDPLNL
jgi:hypothetical protein